MITIEEAKQYFTEERLFSDEWLDLEYRKKEQSLKMATNQINRLKLSSYSDGKRNKNIKNAICEQALYLIQTANTQRTKLIEQGVTSFSVEGLSETYKANNPNKICSEAMEYIRSYLIGVASIC